MKLLSTIVALTLFSISTFAQGNSLSVFSEDGYPFYLILNGVRQNEQAETNVRIDNLTSDIYAAKVIFHDATIPEIDKKFLNVTGVDCKPCEVTYKIKTDKKGEVVMKPFTFNTIFTPPPPSVTVVQYNTTPLPPPILSTSIQVTETTTTTTNGTNDNVNVGMSVGGFNMGVNVNVNDGWVDGSTTTTTTTTSTTTTSMPTQVVVEEVPGCFAMDPGSFNTLINSMQNKSFDDDKLVVAKQATAANCVTSMQVKQIMEQFDWDDNRLEYAKFAYSYCTDQNNYWKVNEAFEWDDNASELSRSIGN